MRPDATLKRHHDIMTRSKKARQRRRVGRQAQASTGPTAAGAFLSSGASPGLRSHPAKSAASSSRSGNSAPNGSATARIRTPPRYRPRPPGHPHRTRPPPSQPRHRGDLRHQPHASPNTTDEGSTALTTRMADTDRPIRASVLVTLGAHGRHRDAKLAAQYRQARLPRWGAVTDRGALRERAAPGSRKAAARR